MRLFELTEKTQSDKVTGEVPKRRNLQARDVKTRSGAGPHSSKKYSRKEKHKNKDNY